MKVLVEDQIKSLIASNCDSDGYIPLPLLEEKMRESDFDVEGSGYTYETLLDMLEAFVGFEIDEEQEPIRVRIAGFKPVPPVVAAPAPAPAPTPAPASPSSPAQPQSQPSFEEMSVNRKIGGIIRKLIRLNPTQDNWLLLTDLGQEMRDQNIKTPDGERLSAFLRRFPSLYEIDSETRFVRSIGIVPPVSSVSAAPAPAPQTVEPSKYKYPVSLYNLFDFCCFPDYSAALAALSKLAVQDGWFILDEPGNLDSCHLLGLKLQLDFALAVRDQQEDKENRICVSLDKASFRTGFHTEANAAIVANFVLNRNRPSKYWQTWMFDRFSVEDA